MARSTDPCQLWCQLETIIRSGHDHSFVQLAESNRAPQVARGLLSRRLDSEALPRSLHRHFGTCVHTLSALQLALFLHHAALATALLDFLAKEAPRDDLATFVNHRCGRQQTTALHLAAYFGMDRVVQQLLLCGADPSVRNARQQTPLNSCTTLACLRLLQQRPPDDTTKARTTPHTSMLLKKAAQRGAARDRSRPIAKPSLVLSSSTSSSSYSSLSSLEEPPVPCFFKDDTLFPHPPNDAKPSSVKKCVRFSPEAILLDVCTRGDSVDDLMEVIHAPRLVPYWEHRLDVPSSLLHLSLVHRRLDVARALISLGADVTKTDGQGCTPLHCAATLTLWPLVALLARHPATLVHARNHAGLTAVECPRLWVDQRKCRGKGNRLPRILELTSPHSFDPTSGKTKDPAKGGSMMANPSLCT